jgi:hypothetical protein
MTCEFTKRPAEAAGHDEIYAVQCEEHMRSAVLWRPGDSPVKCPVTQQLAPGTERDDDRA